MLGDMEMSENSRCQKTHKLLRKQMNNELFGQNRTIFKVHGSAEESTQLFLKFSLARILKIKLSSHNFNAAQSHNLVSSIANILQQDARKNGLIL